MNSTTVLTKSLLDDLHPEKLHAWHRERLAVIYVRQSTPQQVLDHQESTRLQYGLVSRAQALGWAPDRILVIDDDLGKSAKSRAGASGVPTTSLRSEPGSRRDDLWGGDIAPGTL